MPLNDELDKELWTQAANIIIEWLSYDPKNLEELRRRIYVALKERIEDERKPDIL